ncbi:MAG: FHA domain-containing protein [Deltaproteobacteria bacterium]|nr:FHA domain-containing protein [Deltaproteobacteria bacterium]
MRKSHSAMDTDSADGRTSARIPEQSKAERVIQIFVFNGDEYLGWDCFCREKVSIGSHASSDLVLKHEMIMPHHADVQIVGSGDVLISLNETEIDICRDTTKKSLIIDQFDSVKIGPYTLKIKELKNRSGSIIISSDNDTPELQLERYENGPVPDVHSEEEPPEEHADGIYPVKEDACCDDMPVSDQDRYETWPAVDAHREEVQSHEFAESSFHLQEDDTCNDIPAHDTEGYEVQPSSDSHSEEAQQVETAEIITLVHKYLDCEEEPSCTDRKIRDTLNDPQILPNNKMVKPIEDEEEEDEEDDIEASFCLKDRLTQRNADLETCTQEQTEAQFLIEVVKSRNGRVLDVRFLRQRQRYYIKTGKTRFCLAENKGPDGHYFYFDDHFSRIARSNYSAISETDQLCIHEKLYNRKKGIYCDKLRPSSQVTIYDDPFEYHLRCVAPGKSPDVELAKPKDTHYYKHFIKSTFLHVIVLTIIGMFPSYTSQPKNIQTHFVQVDPLQMEEINKRIALPPVQKPKEEPPPVQSAPERTVKKPVKPVKKQVKTQKKTAVASKSPQAGGGYGKGNIKNRNINQTGLLSMLGDNIGLKPQEAMAAVTNLDATTSMQESTADFKVSGIVGKLGTAKIEIPQSGIVSTKGSSQVLRSAGAHGEGQVAALEKGVTGEGQVMAMVSAEMDKTVKIQGGMSREAVKKVIDQHLDEITYCYETALIANPSLMGKVIFEWKILLSGNVGEVRIKSSSINSSEIHGCIKQSIKSWQFPKPKGSEVVVSYPFIFDIVGF